MLIFSCEGYGSRGQAKMSSTRAGLERTRSWLGAAPKVIQFDVDSDSDRSTQVRSILSSIVDPEAGEDILKAGLVQSVDIGPDDIKVTLRASNVNSLVMKEIKNMLLISLTSLDWLDPAKVVIDLSVPAKPPAPPAPAAPALPNGLANVKQIIAVSSCKGGVGKSTVSVNLAYTLSSQGHKVGILDADIYGPSLPTMTRPEDLSIGMSPQGQMLPLTYRGVRLMSMGFINKGASIMRGPMVNQILNQFVGLTQWGELDYLVIDMPPGTGDIQLTLSQILNISCAVIVTTPQRLAFVDVVKGIDLFDAVNVPCVAVVENMADFSTFSFDDGFFSDLVAALPSDLSSPTARAEAQKILSSKILDRRQPTRVFGAGHNARMTNMWGIDHIHSLPLLESVSEAGDGGTPFVLKHPHSAVASTFTALAESVKGELAKLAATASAPDRLFFDEEKNLVLLSSSSGAGAGAGVSPRSLRLACRCAVCCEELSGTPLLDPASVPSSIKPLGMAPIGRYAMSVDWSDGHKSLYPLRAVRALQEQLKADA